MGRPNAATFGALVLIATVAGIGLYDDWQKISNKRNEGLSVKYKFALLTLAVILADFLAIRYVGVTQNIIVPGLAQNLVLGPGLIGVALLASFCCS